MEERENEYTVELSGGLWCYSPDIEPDAPWERCNGRQLFAAPFPLRTAADFRAVADVMNRWERDQLARERGTALVDMTQ